MIVTQRGRSNRRDRSRRTGEMVAATPINSATRRFHAGPISPSNAIIEIEHNCCHTLLPTLELHSKSSDGSLANDSSLDSPPRRPLEASSPLPYYSSSHGSGLNRLLMLYVGIHISRRLSESRRGSWNWWTLRLASMGLRPRGASR